VIPTPTPNGNFTHEAAPGPDAAADERCLMAELERCLMAELSIIQAGHHYFHDGYRYDRLSDAVWHAQSVQGRTRRPGSSATP
jgi:hypothetical protein